MQIDKMKTALVVIDLQNGIVGRTTAPHSSDSVVKNAAAIAEAFRKNDMPVFLVRVCPSADGKDALHPVADTALPAQAPPPGYADIVAGLNQQPTDFVITKHQWGAFTALNSSYNFADAGLQLSFFVEYPPTSAWRVLPELPMNTASTKYLLKMRWRRCLLKSICIQLTRYSRVLDWFGQLMMCCWGLRSDGCLLNRWEELFYGYQNLLFHGNGQ